MSSVPPPIHSHVAMEPPKPGGGKKTPWLLIIGIFFGLALLTCGLAGFGVFQLVKNPEIMDSAIYSERPKDEAKWKRVVMLRASSGHTIKESYPDDWTEEEEQELAALMAYLEPKITNWGELSERAVLRGKLGELDEWEVWDYHYGMEEAGAILWSMGFIDELLVTEPSDWGYEIDQLSDEFLKQQVGLAKTKTFKEMEGERRIWQAWYERVYLEYEKRDEVDISAELKALVAQVEKLKIDIPIKNGDFVAEGLDLTKLSDEDLYDLEYRFYGRSKALGWCMGYFDSYVEAYAFGLDGFTSEIFQEIGEVMSEE